MLSDCAVLLDGVILTLSRIFIESHFHWVAFSLSRFFTESHFHWVAFSLSRIFIESHFIESHFHWVAFSLSHIFIESLFHWVAFSLSRIFVESHSHWLVFSLSRIFTESHCNDTEREGTTILIWLSKNHDLKSKIVSDGHRHFVVCWKSIYIQFPTSWTYLIIVDHSSVMF